MVRIHQCRTVSHRDFGQDIWGNSGEFTVRRNTLVTSSDDRETMPKVYVNAVRI